jgi:hypothetical protein
MKIIHRITTSFDNHSEFAKVGVELGSPTLGASKLKITATTFLIKEDDPRWPEIPSLVERFRAADMVSTEFSSAELLDAKYLKVWPSWHHGYPQPEDDFGYLGATYDLSYYCQKCGIGGRQIAPFRMKKEPTWGRRSILQLNWVYDEYFVKPDVWSAIFKPFGVQCRSVVKNRTGEVLDSVVQLDITEFVDVQVDGLEYEQCPNCSRIKYLPVVRGFLPKPLQEIEASAFKSNQWFGSGASADKSVMFSNDLYRKINAAKFKGIEFGACKR